MKPTTTDLGLLCEQIRLLVLYRPDLVLYVPGKPLWGILRLPKPEHFLLNLEDLIKMVVGLNPNMVPPGLVIESAPLARALGLYVQVVSEFPGREIVTIDLGGRVYQSCCRVVIRDAPWLSWNGPMAPSEPGVSIELPQEVFGIDALPRVSEWATWNHVSLATDAFATEREWGKSLPPPNIDSKADEARLRRLFTMWYTKSKSVERSRCRLMGYQAPPWLDGPGDPDVYEELLAMVQVNNAPKNDAAP